MFNAPNVISSQILIQNSRLRFGHRNPSNKLSVSSKLLIDSEIPFDFRSSRSSLFNFSDVLVVRPQIVWAVFAYRIRRFGLNAITRGLVVDRDPDILQ